MVHEAGRELPEDPRPPLHLPQQQTAAVRRDASPVEPGHDVTLRKGVKPEADLGTLCLHRAVSFSRRKDPFASSLCLNGDSLFNIYGEKSGLGATTATGCRRAR